MRYMASSDAAPARPVSRVAANYHWVVIGASFVLLMAAMGFGRYTYPMVLPNMQASFGLTYAPMGLLGTTNLIGYVAFSLLSGLLATRFGAKPIIAGFIMLLGLSMIGMGLMSTYWIAFILMILAGAGTAGVFTPVSALCRNWVPPNRIGLTMGILSAGCSAGIVIAASIIPAILAGQGPDNWRQAWIYLGTAAVLLTVLAVVALREPQYHGSGKGSGAVSAFAWGHVFRNPTIGGLCLVYFLFGFYQIYATFFVAYLRGPLKLPTDVAGNIWFWWSIAALVLMAFWGWLSDGIGRKQAIVPCSLVVVVSTLVPVFWHDLPFLYLSAILFGGVFAGPMTIILASAGEAVAPPYAPAAMGLVTASFGLGQAVSPALAGLLIDMTGSFYPGFMLSAVVVLLSMVVILLLPLHKHVA